MPAKHKRKRCAQTVALPRAAGASHGMPSSAGSSSVPESFLDATIEFWQTSAGRNLTHEDAREIVENMTGFFAVLRQWRDAERP
jgi:hypothetical protein